MFKSTITERWLVMVTHESVDQICDGGIDLTRWLEKLPSNCLATGISVYTSNIDAVLEYQNWPHGLPWGTRIRSSLRKAVGAFILTGEYGELRPAEEAIVKEISMKGVPVFVMDENDYCQFNITEIAGSMVCRRHGLRGEHHDMCHAQNQTKVFLMLEAGVLQRMGSATANVSGIEEG